MQITSLFTLDDLKLFLKKVNDGRVPKLSQSCPSFSEKYNWSSILAYKNRFPSTPPVKRCSPELGSVISDTKTTSSVGGRPILAILYKSCDV